MRDAPNEEPYRHITIKFLRSHEYAPGPRGPESAPMAVATPPAPSAMDFQASRDAATTCAGRWSERGG